MNWQHFDKNEYHYQILFWLVIGIIQASIGSVTFIADYQRLGIPLEPWKPIVWESSSQIAGGLLILLIVWWDRKLSQWQFGSFKKILAHCLFTIVFSVSHVVGMVLIRKLVHYWMGGSYDFGDWPKELVYEYTKDAYSYFWIIGVIYAYRFIVSRLRGEATVIGIGEDTRPPDKPERLLVKKIGKEFILRIEDIDWIEAAGNYMNLHVKDRIYPLRETMSQLESKLNPSQFVRIHRSSMVNLDRIKEILPLDSGDYQVTLNTDQRLKLSRRYREKVKNVLFNLCS